LPKRFPATLGMFWGIFPVLPNA